MSKFSREKGKRGEREVAKIIQKVLDEIYGENAPRIQRNTLQSDKGGFDLVGLEDFAIEVKRHEKLNLKSWWRQTVRQAGEDKFPVLFYRQNNTPWSVMFIDDGSIRISDVNTFTSLLKEYLIKKLNQ